MIRNDGGREGDCWLVKQKKRGARGGLKERKEGGGVGGRERAIEYLSVGKREKGKVGDKKGWIQEGGMKQCC